MIRIFWRLGLLCVAMYMPAAVAAPVAWLPLKNTTAVRVADPVFGGDIVVYEAGPEDAPTVVLIHGIGDNGARDWRNLIIDLAPDYHIVAVDMPGFSASSKGNQLYAPEQLAVAVHGAISEYVEQPYSLIGHSLGAAVSLAYAGLYSDELERLVLVDAPGVLHRYIYTRFLGEHSTSMIDGMLPVNSAWINGLLSTQMQQLETNGFKPELLLHSPWARLRLLGGDPKIISAYAVAQHDYSSTLRNLGGTCPDFMGRARPAGAATHRAIAGRGHSRRTPESICRRRPCAHGAGAEKIQRHHSGRTHRAPGFLAGLWTGARKTAVGARRHLR